MTDANTASDAVYNAATDADVAAELPKLLMQSTVYSQDPWFASACNTPLLESNHGLHYRGDALVVPDIPEL